MDPKTVDNINAISVFLFVIFALFVVIKITSRYVNYKRRGLKVPELLPRDFLLILGLVVPFAGVLIFRAFGISARAEWWYPLWAIGSDILGVAGMANWAYFEYFRIEK